MIFEKQPGQSADGRTKYIQDSLEGYFGERSVSGDVPSLDSGNYQAGDLYYHAGTQR